MDWKFGNYIPLSEPLSGGQARVLYSGLGQTQYTLSKYAYLYMPIYVSYTYKFISMYICTCIIGINTCLLQIVSGQPLGAGRVTCAALALGPPGTEHQHGVPLCDDLGHQGQQPVLVPRVLIASLQVPSHREGPPHRVLALRHLQAFTFCSRGGQFWHNALKFQDFGIEICSSALELFGSSEHWTEHCAATLLHSLCTLHSPAICREHSDFQAATTRRYH